jgi:hypothetical protein
MMRRYFCVFYFVLGGFIATNPINIYARERSSSLIFFRRALLVNFKNSSHVLPAVCVHFSNGARRQLAPCGHQLALNYPLISD